MRTLLGFGIVLCAFIVPAFAAAMEPGPFEACNQVVPLKGKYIYKNSAPERVGGPGTPIKGFRINPTLIAWKKKISHAPTRIYAANGDIIGSCPWAEAHDTVDGRYRCTMHTGKLRQKAIKRGGAPLIYFRIKKGVCAVVPDAGKCYSSTKGLCNQTIKK